MACLIRGSYNSPICVGYGNKDAGKIIFVTETEKPKITNCKNCGANQFKNNQCEYCKTKY